MWRAQKDQSDPAYSNRVSSHHRLCFNLDRSKNKKMVMLSSSRSCVCVLPSLSQEMTRVFCHADARLALGEREGNRQRGRRRGKMKGGELF